MFTLEVKKSAMLLLTLWLCGCGVIVTPEPPPTLTPFVMQSLFAGDTCAPPCWFGLTAGVNTSCDVAEFLEAHPDIEIDENETVVDSINPETGCVTEGRYTFRLPSWEQGIDDSYIDVKHGIIDLILVDVNENISPRQMITAFGLPDQVRLSNDYGAFVLRFIYLPFNLVVSMRASRFVCDITSQEEDFHVANLTYFSPRAAMEATSLSENPSLPRILRWHGGEERAVPLEVWEAWMNGAVVADCDTAWESLPIGVIVPELMPTVTPER
jgi:hypothetical protein